MPASFGQCAQFPLPKSKVDDRTHRVIVIHRAFTKELLASGTFAILTDYRKIYALLIQQATGLVDFSMSITDDNSPPQNCRPWAG